MVISLQPGLRFPDVLPTNGRGLSRAVYREEDIEAVMEASLFDEAVRQDALKRTSDMGLDSGAAARIVRLLDSMIARRSTGHQLTST
jgi:hypothetical protein